MRYKAEYVYAVAANMDRGSRISCEVYHRGQVVLMFNTDRTMIARWQVSEELPGEVRFFAADWEEGCKIEARGESIAFSRAASDYEWSKCSRVPAMGFDEVEETFEHFVSRWLPDSMPSITLNENILRFLDERLRHTEFKVENGKFELIQRDIYTGEIKRTEARGRGGLLVGRPTVETLETRAMRTLDFQSLFLLAKQFDLFFDEHYTYGRSADDAVEVLIANCLYDEMSDINILTPTTEPGTRDEPPPPTATDLQAAKKMLEWVDLMDRTRAELDSIVASVKGFELPCALDGIEAHYGLQLKNYQADWNAFYLARYAELTGGPTASTAIDVEAIQKQISDEYIIIWELFQVQARFAEVEKKKPEPVPETPTTTASEPTTGQVSTPVRRKRRVIHGRQEPEGAAGESESDTTVEGSEGSRDEPKPVDQGQQEDTPSRRRRR